MWARVALGRGPWSADDVPNVRPPGWQEVPPPIPDATATYTYLTQTGAAAWASRTWAGAQATPTFPGGGILAAPRPEDGVVHLWLWWPDAPTFHVMRETPDGVRTPVRGAFGLPVTTPTRRNVNPNGGFETGLNGYTQLHGGVTLTQSQTAPYVAHRASAMRMMSNTTTTGVISPGVFAGAGSYTVGFNIGSTTLPTSVVWSIAWLDNLGASAGSTTLTLTADELNAMVGQTTRVVRQFAAPTNAVSGAATLTVSGITASVTEVYLDAVIFERGTTDGSYFDGTTALGAQWTGVAELSESLLAPVIELDDGEAPMDIPVTYQLFVTVALGGRVESTPVVLDSNDQVWITHPSTPDTPVLITPLGSAPVIEYAAVQGVFYPLGRRYPVVISASQRHSATGTITFGVVSTQERVDLEALLSDLSPVLLRVPAGYHPGDMWLSLATLTIDPQGRKPWQETRTITSPFWEVEAPDALITA